MQTPNWLRSFRGVLVSPDPRRSKANIPMLQALPEFFEAGAAADSARTVNTILLVDHEQDAGAVSRIQQQLAEDEAAVILCSGPAAEEGWREAALSAGALACFSRDTPLADQICLLRVAVRHISLLRDLDHIREESNRICQTLLECFGGANESLLHARGEAEQIRDDLEKVRERILRAFI
ncbi:MAG TPA: hypothetical protein VML01_01760 [Bryobacterales bacterium]|nr:hypothetical protein [Bryobacterales bacterium]